MRFWTYIITNKARTTIYTGMTNNISSRVVQHMNGSGDKSKFTGRYNVGYLLYYEEFQWVNDAIRREKQIKKWSRAKKIKLIQTLNPNMDFLDPPT